MSESSLDTPIEFIKGVGPKRADWLRTELGIYSAGDLLEYLPFRYEDRSKFATVSGISTDSTAIQLKGVITGIKQVGSKRGSRLVARFQDDTGSLDLVWFKGAKWFASQIPVQQRVVVFGKPTAYQGKWNMPHPEIELESAFELRNGRGLQPVYRSTEKLTNRGLASAGIGRVIRSWLGNEEFQVPEILPQALLEELQMPGRLAAFRSVHLPADPPEADSARRRLKFEELLYLQLTLLRQKKRQTLDVPGVRFEQVGDHFNQFYKDHLTFELTGAQKRVMREIRVDVNTGWHMNRLLQGDVGSGKTMIAMLTALLALDNGCQACVMAPTEILANQHLESFREALKGMPIRVELLTGSVKTAARKPILQGLASGEVHILIGTHALIEPAVEFKRLGLAIIDEQHRFGVAQRSKLWAKASPPPHVLVMTATPIPRTLAMTAYGDLDVSIIDEMPPGRKSIKTVHRHDSARLSVFKFMEDEVKQGRQVYVVYPLIEESATLDYKDLMDGYESLSRRFPLPDFRLGIVHGRMKPKDKDIEMARFSEGTSQILVATTVIEVGVNVPNASVMVVESAERFGLAQLHQLRGRVGRGSEQSYCILMTSGEISKEANLRMETMCRTNDGFEIAEVDMELRGPGDLMGTQQSGVPDLKMADLMRDREILTAARYIASRILEEDAELELPKYAILKTELKRVQSGRPDWSRIS
ncbi:MAG: ATP-dependent DNA helicase RecG [Flavobacteriales bacterium]|nr:ATP-dependent DNA helicase RecG [Flavobacteriales bacterium]